LYTLAGGVAHELNNALVPVIALAQLIRDDLPPDDPLRDDIAVIIGASERARDLVKQILAYGRKEEDLIRREIDLAAVASEALRMLRASLPATIRIAEDIEAVPTVLGDAGKFHQIIVNLVTNASQAIGSDAGTITVSVGMDAGSVRLSVADTGSGMDSATTDRVFEPFFTTKGVGEGTGLGLSVVHGIVTSYGGRIDVRSQPGEGTLFSVLLPPSPAIVAMAA
jgi:signal transduction histidine kinase